MQGYLSAGSAGRLTNWNSAMASCVTRGFAAPARAELLTCCPSMFSCMSNRLRAAGVFGSTPLDRFPGASSASSASVSQFPPSTGRFGI